MVARERLKAVPGRHAQVVQSSGSIQKSQLPRGFKSGRQAHRLLAVTASCGTSSPWSHRVRVSHERQLHSRAFVMWDAVAVAAA